MFYLIKSKMLSMVLSSMCLSSNRSVVSTNKNVCMIQLIIHIVMCGSQRGQGLNQLQLHVSFMVWGQHCIEFHFTGITFCLTHSSLWFKCWQIIVFWIIHIVTIHQFLLGHVLGMKMTLITSTAGYRMAHVLFLT